MYSSLLPLHSMMRWLVLGSLVWAVARGAMGVRQKIKFTNWDNRLRHWTATLAHIQLLAGMFLYAQSPLVKYFWSTRHAGRENSDTLFFSIPHGLLMLVAIVVITVGSALAKRRQYDQQKFRTMLIWYAVALLMIMIAVPWPFSPFANRPYFR